MKKLGILFTIAAIVLSFSTTSAQEKFEVANDESTIIWKGYKPTGSHHGTIMLTSGFIEIEDEEVTGGSFTVDMSTIKDADGSARLEGHLKSKDFFEVETFSTSTFMITDVETEEDGEVTITGDMTIKGITKEISFSAEVSETDTSITLISAVFQINRAEFNVTYQSKTFFNNLKEKFINDDFDLQVTIVVTK
jgi:polyisoprenoid-binding protein YceI